MKKKILILNNDYFEKSKPKNFGSKFIIIKNKIFIDIIFCSLGLYFDKNSLSSQLKNLKLLVTPTTGLDHINQTQLKEFNLKVISLNNFPFFLNKIPSTAEHTWAMILALSRKIVLSSNDVLFKNNWRRDSFPGKQLKDKKLCIIGFGRLGKKVANYGKVFGMKVFAFDKDKSKFKKNYSFVKSISFNNIFKIADVLTIHVPFKDENVNFISNKNIKNLKKDSILVNTSRGNLFSEDFALNLLYKKKIFGLGLDVFKKDSIWETKKKFNFSLKKYKKSNLIITPHLGGNTIEARIQTTNFLLEKLMIKSIN